MTDRVDLDALDIGDEDEDERPRRGDWFWHDEGDPATEPTSDGPTSDDLVGDATDTDVTADDAPNRDTDAADDEAGGTPGSEPASDDDSAAKAPSARTRVPHVPRENEKKPVGIPVEGGGAGGTSARAAAVRENDGTGSDEGDAATPGDDPTVDDPAAGTGADTTAASGPHGGAPSAMTMAFTYSAMKRLDSPVVVLANAAEWTDWIGVIGDVDAYVINKFVREEGLDIDFFNGAGTGPAERLREISANANSMFSAERKVLVGVDADREIGDRTDWEFVPLTEAASAAGWDLVEAEE